MLRNLLKHRTRLDAPDPNARITALAELGDDAQDDFARVFLDDPDTAVRLTALARLTRLPPLVKGLDDVAVAAPAAERLRTLIDDDTPPEVRLHPALLRAEVASAEDAEAAARAAAAITDADMRAAAILSAPRASTRLAIAETMWDVDALTALAKRARGADSALLRLARERLAAHRAALKAREQEDDLTEETLRAAVIDARDPHYEARRDALERRWRDHLDAIANTDRVLARYGVAPRDVAALRRRLPERQAPANAAVDKEIWRALVERAEALAPALLEAISATPSIDAALPRAEAAKAQWETLATEWSALANAQPPAPALSAKWRAASDVVAARAADIERAAALRQAVVAAAGEALPALESAENADAYQRDLARRRKAVEQLIARHRWPDDVPEPEQLTLLRQRQQALVEAIAQGDSATTALADEVAAALIDLKRCVEAGEARQAAGREREIRGLIKRLPRAKAQRFQAELTQVGGTIRQLRAWRQYAETPRRETLCREMEALAEQPLAADAQTEAVRALRARWNALGGVSSRRDGTLKKRFDDAAERAFAPCRAHYQALSEQRAFNLQQRRAIIEALEGYIARNDWEHADWRGVETVLRQARAEWRNYHPVERKDDRALRSRFEQLTERIHKMLKEAWDRNVNAKEALIAEAAKARESGAQATAKANAVKALQRRWKEAGPVPRRVDQRLWKRFRAECDAVFEARAGAMNRHRQRRSAIDEAESLISELERRMDLDPALGRDTVAEYRSRFDALGTLPKALQRRTENTIRDADRAAVDNQRTT